MKQLLILSGKGGTGKTTIASAFIKLAKAKAFADCDVDAPNLHLVLDQESQPKSRDFFGMDKAEIDQSLCTQCDICRQSCRFDAIEVVNNEYKVNCFACEGCSVCEFVCPRDAISMGPSVAGELMLYSNETVFSTAQLKMGSGNSGLLVTEVKSQMKESGIEGDLAIIDGSPGLGCPVIASLSGVDMVLIVAEPSVSGINDMERIIKTAEGFQTKIGVCINKYDTNIKKTKEIERFCGYKKLPFVGEIPFDKKAIWAINNGKSIVDIQCQAGDATKEIFNKAVDILFMEKPLH
ncbi:MAG TPA: ATP-binding protein [Clostridia bacterium]|nr:ATP-binding protein [Clostridia bacterium]